ncbi:MAG: 1-(5-phosphoribosyl)-5-[(5-phosphoribosylamino)methylideneamino]imidazole-4-carboxamide isomerase [Bacteroidia bacterium]|nr:1-(5-phosphoribosyl)-5-[(5-phosphoribosylamino)methylideneamino]imidazole-4-carboxamide isomerase [Bacteroidia bacterium]
MIQIIPAIDIIDGKCVRLTQGDYAQKTVYNENPLEVAKEFEEIGIRRLHLVDLDGAKRGGVVNLKVLEAIAAGTDLIIDFGGGIKSDNAIEQVFNAGASIATIGSVAVKDQPLFFGWIKKFGANKILLGADVKNEKIAINGWLESTDLSIIDFVRQNVNAGVKTVFCTDISTDGMLEGPSVKLYEKIISTFPKLDFIASGGVASLNDIYELDRVGCKGVIIGKAIYEGRITFNELRTITQR